MGPEMNKDDLIDKEQLEEARRLREELEAERSKEFLIWLARLGVGVLFFSLVLFVVYMAFYVHAPDELAELTSTLIGTLIGALLAAATGLWLYRYQSRKNEEARVEQLREALIAELYATFDRLKTTSAVRVSDPTGSGGPDVVVVLTHLEPTACEENIRSALFGHKNTVSLTRLARLMREYTKAADILSSLLWRPQVDPVSLVRAYQQAANVKGLQQFVIVWCETILKGFEVQGLELPPEDKYYSDPTREAPPDFVRYDQ